MPAATVEIEVFILIDDLGDHVSANSPEAARERYEEEVQPLANAGGFRIVALKVKVPLPESVELSIEVPASGRASLACV